jgi:hypothetical protein
MPAINAIYIAPDLPQDRSRQLGKTHFMGRVIKAALGRRSFSSWVITTPFMARAFEAAGFRPSYVGPLRAAFAMFCKVKGRLVRARGWDYTNLGEPTAVQNSGSWTVRSRTLLGKRGNIFNFQEPVGHPEVRMLSNLSASGGVSTGRSNHSHRFR